eukprot:4138645-Amphidinium_carterae.1
MFYGIAAELEPPLRDLVRQRWPTVHTLTDAMTLSPTEILKQLSRRKCTGVLLIAGTPCQPFSSLGKQQEFRDSRTAPMSHFFVLRDRLKQELAQLQMPFWWLLEE